MSSGLVPEIGFLLERVGADTIAEALSPHVEKKARRVTPLDASLPRTGSHRSKRWLIAVNTDVEVDY